MKLTRFTLAVVLALTSSAAFAQDPAPAETKPPAEKPAAPAKPLTPADKQFLKGTLESVYFLTNITDKHKRDAAKGEETKKFAEKTSKDANGMWEDFAGLASKGGVELPTKLQGSDGSKVERLGKAGDKFDKEFYTLAEKEGKRLARTLESGAKSAQLNVELKTAATKWAQLAKDIETGAESGAKAAMKAK